MKRHIWIILVVLGLFAWFGMGLGTAQAQGVIYPVDTDPNSVNYLRPKTDSPVTVSISIPGGPVITDSWLPKLDEPVEIVVNGAVNYTINLVPSAAADPTANGVLATSAYPGVCTNSGDPSDLTDDFTLDGNTLTPHDCGGMAVVTIGVVGTPGFTFVIPQDDNFNGIANNWEKLYCASGVTCLNRNADIDIGPDAGSPSKDGWANIDEYRGWRVNGQYVRGDPQVKDVFIHIEQALQCIGTAVNFTGDGGTYVDLDFFFWDDPAALFFNVDTLSPEMNVHRIGSDEWVDNFSHYDVISRVILTGSSPGNAITDRWINQNAVHPLGSYESTTKLNYVKGVRVIQCADLDRTSPLGLADKKPPDLFHKDNGNAVLFIHRIVNSFLNKIKAGGTLELKYYTFEGRKWVDTQTFDAPWDPLDPSIIDDSGVKSIIKLALAHFLAHEALEHSFDVTSTGEGTRKVSYGYHHAEGTGTNVDLRVTHKYDNKGNKFYIPKYHGISDKREIRVLSSQVVP